MDYQTARKHMVDSQVRPNDVTDLGLQAAMSDIPRELFLPSAMRNQAYVEREHVYGDDAGARVMLKPRDFAKLVAAAAPRNDELILDIGCGTGYSTAVLARLSEMVVAVEPDEGFRSLAQDNLVTLKIDNAAIVDASLDGGVPDQGPFDLIVIAAGIARKPEALLDQLKDGGRLAAIWRNGRSATGVIISRENGVFSQVNIFDAGSGTVLESFSYEKAFTF